ncbi:MAG: hypothetical protein JNM43_09955, partial [Planctomycetaceae bacterium]|nr:hypothetical protein [Planctomycetaceae bacterium]
DGTSGKELWRSDGTSGGTYRVADINAGPNSSNPTALTAVNGTIYFVADNGINGQELWKSDGSQGGTALVRDIVAGAGTSSPSNLTNVAGTLFFTANWSNLGIELCKTDGTVNGTGLVKDIRTGAASSAPEQLTNVGGTLVFAANDGTNGVELWKSNGQTAGTTLVSNIHPTDSSNPKQLRVLNGVVLFVAADATTGAELWSYNTGTGITQQVADIRTGVNSSLISPLTVVGNSAFFAANDGTNGQELWKTDGTAVGTVLVKDISPGSGLAVTRLINANGTLFFTATQTATGNELWKSDGTALGTTLVADVATGTASSGINNLTVAGNRVFFSANDGINGDQLWSTDLSGAGLYRHRSASGQPTMQFSENGSGISDIVESKGGLVFAGTSDQTGRELSRISLAGIPVIQQPGILVSTTRPTLSWTAIPGAVNYEVWIRNQSTGVNPFYRVVVSTLSHVPTSDLPLGRYNLWVRGINAASETGPWSIQSNFFVDQRVQVNAVTRLQSTARPTISWQALPGAARYEIYVNNLTTGAQRVYSDTNITGTSWTSTTDMPMGLYRGWVRAFDTAGNAGGWSAAFEVHVLPAPAPLAPLNPTFATQPQFSWSSLAGAVTYEVFVRNLSTGAIVQSATGLTTTNWTPSAPLATGMHRWWVNAVAAGNYRSQSVPVTDFRVGGQTDLLTPSGTINTGTPEFRWKPVDGAATYELFVTRVDVPVAGIINATGLTSTTYTPTTPLPAGSYRVWVRAISTTAVVGPWSALVTFSIA